MGKSVPGDPINSIYFDLINISWVQRFFCPINPIKLCTVCVFVLVGVGRVHFYIVVRQSSKPQSVPSTLLDSICIRACVRTRIDHHIVSSLLEYDVVLVVGQGTHYYVIKEDNYILTYILILFRVKICVLFCLYFIERVSDNTFIVCK